ncbi:MAG: sensor histidine kinase [Dokdonella sp.]
MGTQTQLADFIEANAVAIADAAEAFARAQAPTAVHLDAEALRDHLPEIIEAVILDLRTSQSNEQQRTKSEGRSARNDGPKTAAQNHGRLRAKAGFNADQMVAEYRAMRASVMRLWAEQHVLSDLSFEELMRFNEAIDQAVAESVAHFSAEAESWRQVFLGVLGHDLRGPLDVIVMTAQIMSMMARDTPFTEQTDRLIRSGKRMTDLLDDLLDYSRTSLGVGMRITRSDRDLAMAVREEIDLLRTLLPQASIEFEATGSMEGSVDVSRIRIAVANLVYNAVKYGKANGTIYVTLEGNGDETKLTVKNDGAPLTTIALNSLFEPLRRGSEKAAHGEERSLGLGLFIVREIAKAHGGEVSAQTTDGSTIFTVTLPKASVAAPNSSLQ